MHNYLELKIWQQSRKVVKEVYSLTGFFPQSQIYGLSSQMQQAAISISSNIAEGSGRSTDKEFLRFLDIANGSAFELESQLFLCLDLGFSKKEEVNPLIAELKEIQKMIYKFKQSLESKSNPS
jgi:four helix bundle protein